jgi:SAM-dependent methyltransferase
MKDRFSSHANQYAQFRPTYPPALYEFIYRHVQHFDVVWDAGTGNGQAAYDLSKKFKKVIATDISTRQIENAHQTENIFYSIASEKSIFDDSSFDLITVAQAAHWFNMEVFSEEIKRVLKPDGIIALWGYGLLRINPEMDSLIHHFYTQIIGSFWDKERRHIDEHYKNLYFPFQEIPTPAFAISVLWTLAELKGYLTTWSAVQKYITAHQHNPVENLISQIQPHWKKEQQAVNFPLFLKLGRIGVRPL